MSALKIVWWAVYAVCLIVTLLIGIFVALAPLESESLIPKIVETLFSPVSLILIGFAMFYPNARLQSLAASLALVSALLCIGFTWGYLINAPLLNPEGWFFVQLITAAPQVIYLYLYLSGKGMPEAE